MGELLRTLVITEQGFFPLHQLEEPVVLRIGAPYLMCEDPADFPGVHVRSHWQRPGVQGAVQLIGH